MIGVCITLKLSMADNYTNSMGGLGGMSAGQADAQMQANFKQTQEQSINTLKSMVNVKEGADGKTHFLGFTVPNEFSSTLRLAANILPNYVDRFVRGGIYDHASKAMDSLNARFKFSSNPRIGQKAGLTATAAMSGLLVGLQPISDVIHGVRERGRERDAIEKSLEIIKENYEASYADNEVIKTAMERTNETLKLGLKQAAAQMPTVLLNGFLAVGSYKDFAKVQEGKQRSKEILKEATSEAKKDNNWNEVLSSKLKDKQEFEKVKAEYLEKGLSETEIAEAREKFLADEQRKRERREEHLFAEEKSVVNPKQEGQIDEAAKMVALSATGGFSEFLSRKAAKDSKERKPCAYELITELQDKINSGSVSGRSDITEDVIAIFNQNEIDRGRSGIGAAMLEKLRPLAERIGEVVAHGELDPLSLVNFVGEGKVVNRRRFVKEEQLEKIIDEQRAVFGSHEKTPLDEFLADFQNPTMILQAVKDNLHSLEGREKAVFASLFSDDVLLASGIAKKEIAQLRKDGHDQMFEFIKSSALELAKKDPEELKSYGLSDKQIEAVAALNELLISGNEKEVKSTVDRGGEAISAIRMARLEEQAKGGGPDAKKYWTDKIRQKVQIPTPDKTADMSAVEKLSAARGGEGVENQLGA